MVMEYKRRTSSYFTYDHELYDDPQSSSENGADATAPTCPSKKSRRSIQKRVVSVGISDIEGSRSKGDAYPPSDSWAWRKYGQKPIKGSPYPRGYYRCSSSKGCPARKQVERSRMDPTRLIITYACEHNHALPTNKHQHHNQHQVVASPNVNAPSPSTPIAADCSPSFSSPSNTPPLHINPFGDPIQLEFVEETLMLGSYLEVEYSWISNLSFDHPTLVGPKCEDIQVVTFHMKQEDELLFGDLDELPECSLVFR